MAKIKEISVEVGYTKNLGNYENIKFSAGLTVDVEPGDDSTKTFETAWNKAGEEIRKQLDLFSEEKKSGIKKGL